MTTKRKAAAPAVAATELRIQADSLSTGDSATAPGFAREPSELAPERRTYFTAGGIPVRFRTDLSEFSLQPHAATPQQLRLHLTLARLQLLRGFDELLCLDGVTGIEHLPHQIETVRKVLRRFRGRVLLADEVGLGKTIEACLLLREFLLRRLAKRILILVPNPLVSQWQEELAGKFHLEFTVPPRTAQSSRTEFWESHDRVLVSTSYARTGKRPEALASVSWDLVIVDEAHHCRNRTTKLWKLINSLKRRHMFLLTATPVQNNLLELYSLLTLLEPGHLKTEADFRRQFITKGNPRDPRNRRKLQELLGEVMIRNTRSLVQINLPPRYAQTILAVPGEQEAQLLNDIQQYLRSLIAPADGNLSVAEIRAESAELDSATSQVSIPRNGESTQAADFPNAESVPGRTISDTPHDRSSQRSSVQLRLFAEQDTEERDPQPAESAREKPASEQILPLHSASSTSGVGASAEIGLEQDGGAKETADEDSASDAGTVLSRMKLQSILMSLGSHPATAAFTLESLAESDSRARLLCDRARQLTSSAKDEQLLRLLAESRGHKVLVFAGALRTLHRLQDLLAAKGISCSVFSGEQSAAEKDAAVELLKNAVDIMLCTDSAGEGRNLQFADTLINYDLPWNPMRIEQRIGRVHRFGQTQDVFIFNLCTAGTVESRILRLLNDKIRMFELVVGEVGSILGNLDEGQEFESLVLRLWQNSRDDRQLDDSFETLGETLIAAQEEYLAAKNLDEALFGEDFE